MASLLQFAWIRPDGVSSAWNWCYIAPPHLKTNNTDCVHSNIQSVTQTFLIKQIKTGVYCSTVTQWIATAARSWSELPCQYSLLLLLVDKQTLAVGTARQSAVRVCAISHRKSVHRCSGGKSEWLLCLRN